MTPTQLATRFARKIFETRGNHSEAHLSERELVLILEAAIKLDRDMYQRRIQDDDIPTVEVKP